MTLDELKNLSPEDRLIRLKEIEEKNKAEIEEAKLLQESTEAEIEEQRAKKRDIPIPQLKAISIDQLFAGDAKDMWKTKHFISEPKKEVEKKNTQRRLEEQTEEEHRELPDKLKLETENHRGYGEAIQAYQTITQMTRKTENWYHVAMTGEITPEDKEAAVVYRGWVEEQREKLEQYHHQNEAAINKLDDAMNMINTVLGGFYKDHRRWYG